MINTAVIPVTVTEEDLEQLLGQDEEEEGCAINQNLDDGYGVDSFRWFRDSILKRTIAGRIFTSWYYSSGSDRIKQLAENHPRFKAGFRYALKAGAHVLNRLRDRELNHQLVYH